MKFKNKKTKLFLVLGASTLALGSIGFASWVIGVQSTQATGNLNVEVDQASLSNVLLTAELESNKLKIAEKAEVTGADKLVTATQNSGALQIDENAFKFSFKTLSIKVGKGVTETARPKNITVKLKTDLTHNTVSSAGNLIKVTDPKGIAVDGVSHREGTSWTYLAFEKTFTLDYASADSSTDYYVFDLKTQATNLEFTLGTFFDGATDTSICKYYNEIYTPSAYPRDAKFDFLTKQAENIYKELTDMKTALSNDNALTLEVKAA